MPNETTSKHDLLAACKIAFVHVEELVDAFREGRITEHDRLGGTRSNRNMYVYRTLKDAIGEPLPADAGG